MKYPFPNAINKYFSFLFDYGFSIKEKEEINVNVFGNGYYIFMSDKVGLEIVLDRNQVLMRIGKVGQSKNEWLEWSDFMFAYAPNIPAYDLDENIDTQVKRLSELLKQYCQEILIGDFSNQNLHKHIADKLGKSFLERFLHYYPETLTS